MYSSTKTKILIVSYSLIILLVYFLIFIILFGFDIIFPYVASLEVTGTIMLLIWNYNSLKFKMQIGVFLFHPVAQGEGKYTKAWNSIALLIMSTGGIIYFLALFYN